MITYKDQSIVRETCPKRLGPKEYENIFRFSQNEFVSGMEFIHCNLTNAGIVTFGAPIHRSSATNIRLVDCRAEIFFATGAIFNDVTVNGLRTGRHPAIISGCAFRHVVVKGQCGRFILNHNVCHDNDERSAAFHKANEEFYRSVDWALDISELSSSGFELRGSVPVDLVRRNPDEQFIMTREVAQSRDWDRYDSINWFSTAINLFLESKSDRELFVASRRSKKFNEALGFYLRLKEAGLVS